MPDISKHNPRDFSVYDTMETEELKEILRADIESEDPEQDTEQLFYIMNLLADREEKSGVPQKTTQEAYAEFREYYDYQDDLIDAEDMEKGSGSKDKKKTLRRPGILTVLSRAAIITIAILALSVTMVMSVDAFRRPTMKFINTRFSDHSLLSIADQTFGYYPHTDPAEAIKDAPIPEGFKLMQENLDDPCITAHYSDKNSNYINISIISAESVIKYNSEGYECSNIFINSHEALFLVKGEDKKIVWLDEENMVYYMLASRNLDTDEFMKIADYWAMQDITFMESQ